MLEDIAVYDDRVVYVTATVHRQTVVFVVAPMNAVHDEFVLVTALSETDVGEETAVSCSLHRSWLPVVKGSDQIDLEYIVNRLF